MSIQVVTHINFQGEARAALEFYASVFGGSVTIATYEDFGMAAKPGDAKQVIWGQVAAGNGFTIMAFDATERVPFNKGQNAFYVAARFTTPEETKACWEKLKQGAAVRQELGPAPWSALYGMLQDKFGVVWIISVTA